MHKIILYLHMKYMYGNNNYYCLSLHNSKLTQTSAVKLVFQNLNTFLLS